MSKTKTIFDELKAVVVMKLLNTPIAQRLIEEKAAQKISKSQEDQPTKPIAQLHKATGQLTFSDTKKPLHNIGLELWDRDIGTPNDYLAKGITDQNGRFEIYYDPEKAGFKDAPDLELRVIDNRITFNSNNQPVYSNRIAYIIKGGDNVTEKVYDFGTLTVPYWQYNPESPFARIQLPNPEETPDDYAVGRKFQAYEAANTLTPIKAKHIIANTLNPNEPSITQIQADYPPNLTRELEKEIPGYTRSDEYFVLRILNGMNPCLLKRNKSNPNQFKVTFNWDNYEKDNEHDLNNVEAFFELKEGKLLPTAIVIQSRYPDSIAPHSPLKDPVTYTPNDGEKWLQAKRIFRTNSLFTGEVIEHYAKAHVQMEQYAVAVFRNLRKNPIRLMLSPHLKSIININRRGDDLLVEPKIGLFVTNGPLTYPGFLQMCKEVVATYDWKGWKPRQPLCEAHAYAKIANLYWQILTEYVDTFFQKYQQEIVQEWIEIRRLSDDLVEHSMAYQPIQGIMANTDSDYEWYDRNELDKPDLPRPTINGQVKVLRPITVSDSPSVADIDNLKELCRYVIFHTTLWHTWVNDSQTDEGGELAYNSLALRNGSFGSENDPAIAPDIIEATNQLYIFSVLNGIKYGLILKNEDDDVPEELRTNLARYKQQFSDLGYEVGNIRTLINI
ncbi:lipoxygenase family protein [Floridanema evergladense]|uniref:Lipoxygenase family protein n=1 Tax=Floridaenema evergladense BLCC-F167 TaxID=3153639 RepID=A0ABV4WPK8_9CYAN